MEELLLLSFPAILEKFCVHSAKKVEYCNIA